MLKARTLLPLLVLGLTGFAAACSGSGGDGTGGTGAEGAGAGAGTGGSGSGATNGGGNASGAGGSGNASGAGGSGGGSGTGGGGNGNPWTCPSGLEGMVPTLTALTVTDAATAPALSGSNSFLEGPVWIDGALYVSQIRDYGDQPPARVLKLDGSTLSEFIPDSGSNGLAVNGDGQLVAASHGLRGITFFDLANPTAPPTGTVDTGPFNSPNDLTIRADGNIYFTDPTYQCSGCGVTKNAYRISPSGAVTAINPPHGQPNGIALSPDGNTLYIAGSDSGIQKYAVMADGSLGTASPFAAVTGVDGMTVDCAGNLYVTVHASARVDVYQPDGTLLPNNIAVGANVTNVAFGGPNMTTLFITRYDTTLRKVELDIPGLPY